MSHGYVAKAKVESLKSLEGNFAHTDIYIYIYIYRERERERERERLSLECGCNLFSLIGWRGKRNIIKVEGPRGYR